MNSKPFLNRRNGVAVSLAIAAVQFLIPAFVPLNDEQKQALIAFAVIANAVLTGKAFERNPDGSCAETPYDPDDQIGIAKRTAEIEADKRQK